MRTLRIEALGVTGLRAGQMVLVKIDALGLSEYALLEQVTHSYENDIHTMTIETLSM